MPDPTGARPRPRSRESWRDDEKNRLDRIQGGAERKGAATEVSITSKLRIRRRRNPFGLRAVVVLTGCVATAFFYLKGSPSTGSGAGLDAAPPPRAGSDSGSKGSSKREASDATQPRKHQQLPQKSRRKLTLRDLKLGEYLGSGLINSVCYVTLPSWWHQERSLANHEPQDFVLKMTPYISDGLREIEIFDRLHSNPDDARKHKIVDVVMTARNVSNPFYEELERPFALPKSFPKNERRRIKRASRIVALVVPYVDDEGDAGDLETLDEVQLFFKSLLGTLAYAHSLGINNLDISNSNVWLDYKDGRAVVTDWNAGLIDGEEIYDESANFWVLPPENMLEHANGTKIRQTIVSATDVWSVGTWLAHLIFKPCVWINPSLFPPREHYPIWHDFVKELLLSFGGDTVIPFGDGPQDLFDLAPLVGLDRATVMGQDFRPPLYVKGQMTFPKTKCNHTGYASFKLMKSNTAETNDQAIDFLKTAMKINLRDRPDCATLLKHPFLNAN